MRKDLKAEKYGELFKKDRNRLNLTPKEVSRALGFWSESSLKEREDGLKPFSVEEIHTAYVRFGINIGFADAFSAIDEGQVEGYLNKLRQDKNIIAKDFMKNLCLTYAEISPVYRGNYHRIKISTLEKVRALVQFFKTPNADDNRTPQQKISEQQMLRLLGAIFEKQDGTLQNLFTLIYSELDSEMSAKITELAQCRF